jgi:hypothetical protein
MKSRLWDIIPCNPCNSACYLLHANFLRGLIFDPEYGGNMLLRNAVRLSVEYMALCPRRQNSSSDCFVCSMMISRLLLSTECVDNISSAEMYLERRIFVLRLNADNIC